MFEFVMNVVSPTVRRYCAQQSGDAVTYSEVLSLWQESSLFRSALIQCLADSPFAAFHWETHRLSTRTGSHAFEFVLVDTPRFASRRTDRRMFEDYFSTDHEDRGVVRFSSLRGDAELVVPVPRGPDSCYGHMAAFIREAPAEQVHALWQMLGQAATECVQRETV